MDNASFDNSSDISTTRYISTSVGRLSMPLILLVVGLQFAVIIARSLFGETALWLQESVVYVHAAVIVFAVGWTLAEDRHVRIDALKTQMSRDYQRLVERTGLIAVVAVSAIILILSWGFVTASWRVLEGSREVGGLPGLFLLKTLVPLLFVLLGVAAFQRLRAMR
ncbi:MAG: TRAP transporter small permease subunit [Rhizobiaceae bacterium]